MGAADIAEPEMFPPPQLSPLDRCIWVGRKSLSQEKLSFAE